MFLLLSLFPLHKILRYSIGQNFTATETFQSIRRYGRLWYDIKAGDGELRADIFDLNRNTLIKSIAKYFK